MPSGLLACMACIRATKNIPSLVGTGTTTTTTTTYDDDDDDYYLLLAGLDYNMPHTMRDVASDFSAVSRECV